MTPSFSLSLSLSSEPRHPRPLIHMASVVVMATLGTLPSGNGYAEAAPELALSEPEQNRLGIRFEPLGTPRTLTIASLPGVSDVMPSLRQSVLIPFESRIESWSAEVGQRVTAGQTLLQVHSHEGLAFMQRYRRAGLESELCNERLRNLKQRQRNGLAARLDVREQAIQCQQLQDQHVAMTNVLMHLPSEWQSQTQAEFTLSTNEDGWLMNAYQPVGAVSAAGSALAEFWPMRAMSIHTRMTAPQLQQVQDADSAVLVAPINRPTHQLTARIQQRSDVADKTGLFSVWLQIDGIAIAPGQRWLVHLPTAQPGWVVPASARIRADGQHWIFVRTRDGVQPVAVKPVAEGSGSLLLDSQGEDLGNQRAIAISGTSALRSLWLAAEGGE